MKCYTPVQVELASGRVVDYTWATKIKVTRNGDLKIYLGWQVKVHHYAYEWRAYQLIHSCWRSERNLSHVPPQGADQLQTIQRQLSLPVAHPQQDVVSPRDMRHPAPPPGIRRVSPDDDQTHVIGWYAE